MLFSIENHTVQASESCYIAPTAVVIGNVVLASESSVWFNTVIRGDTDTISIGERSNVQDNTVIHTDDGIKVEIGKGVSIGHGCILHGCRIGDNTLVGMGATVLNKARIGTNCIIGANALVTQGMEIPDNSLVLGMPAKVVRPLGDSEIEQNRVNAGIYVRRGKQYLEGLQLQGSQ